MQKLGAAGHPGYDIVDLQKAKTWFEGKGFVTELVCLHDALPADAKPEPAWILVVPDGVRALGLDPDAIYTENMGLDHDKKFFDRRRKKVLNKHARYNLCYAEKSQAPDYESGKGRVVGWKEIPHSMRLQNALSTAYGSKAANLNAELNVYYDPAKCGIGFHGDTERPDVIAARFGRPMNIVYQWFHSSQSCGMRVERMLPHGCIYIMSKKAVGQDWKKSSIYTLRHAAGSSKYTSTKSKHPLMPSPSPSSSVCPSSSSTSSAAASLNRPEADVACSSMTTSTSIPSTSISSEQNEPTKPTSPEQNERPQKRAKR